jgi:hypothetical protein
MRATTWVLFAAALISASASAAMATPSFDAGQLSSAPKAPAPAGVASIQCVLGEQGALTACKVLSESPTGIGLGDAAMKMSQIFKLPGGTPGKVITIPLRFVLTPEQAGQRSSAAAASLPTP